MADEKIVEKRVYPSNRLMEDIDQTLAYIEDTVIGGPDCALACSSIISEQITRLRDKMSKQLSPEMCSVNDRALLVHGQIIGVAKVIALLSDAIEEEESLTALEVYARVSRGIYTPLLEVGNLIQDEFVESGVLDELFENLGKDLSR